MTNENPVIVEIDDNYIVRVKLNRPHVHNAFDEVMIAELSGIWDDLAKNDDIRAIVIEGEGNSFCAGADLGWMKRAATYSKEDNERDAMALAQMLDKFYRMPHLTIAHVYGAAFGGGMGLASCADIAVADGTAQFGLSEVKLGLIPATIAPYVIRAIGARHARRYFQTGERFDGKRAHEIGLAHEYAERPEDAEYIMSRILRSVENNGIQAMHRAKSLFNYVHGRSIDKTLMEETAQDIADIRAGDEAKEGLSAFLEKRKPNWVQE